MVLVFVDHWFARLREVVRTPSSAQALEIGLFQCFALVPGVSRSTATIVGGLAQGFDRRSAADFSFLLAVPTMVVITGYELYKAYKVNPPQAGDVLQLLLGNGVAFLVALLAVRSFVAFITRFGFRAFGFYRIILGGLILLLVSLGYQLSLV